MKFIITESQYNFLLEQKSIMNPPKTNPNFDMVILNNKKFFGLPSDTKITPEYTKKVNDMLSKKKVSSSQRTLLGSLINFIPYYETHIDLTSIIDGILNRNLAEFNSGIIGLSSTSWSFKAIVGLWDYFNEKIQGKENADYDESKREDIVNMSNKDRIELFKRYGRGGFDKWVSAGRPPLH